MSENIKDYELVDLVVDEKGNYKASIKRPDGKIIKVPPEK